MVTAYNPATVPVTLTAPPAVRLPTVRAREKPRAVSVRELRSLGSDFFDALPTDDLAALGSAMLKRSYPAGQIVLLEGAASSVLYVVQAGRLQIFQTSLRGRAPVLRLLPPRGPLHQGAGFH